MRLIDNFVEMSRTSGAGAVLRVRSRRRTDSHDRRACLRHLLPESDSDGLQENDADQFVPGLLASVLRFTHTMPFASAKYGEPSFQFQIVFAAAATAYVVYYEDYLHLKPYCLVASRWTQERLIHSYCVLIVLDAVCTFAALYLLKRNNMLLSR